MTKEIPGGFLRADAAADSHRAQAALAAARRPSWAEPPGFVRYMRMRWLEDLRPMWMRWKMAG